MNSFKGDKSWKAISIMGEFVDSVDKLEQISNINPNIVTVFGGARFKPGSDDYQKAEAFGRIASENGFSIITGGGPGIMEAANKGVHDNLDNLLAPTVKSIGIGIELPFETGNNEYLSHKCDMTLKYFFIRKTLMLDYSKMFVIFKGGMGTLDELFETLTLMQTRKIKKRPIYLVGSSFWTPMKEFLTNQMLSEGTINEEDLDLFVIVDDVEQIKF